MPCAKAAVIVTEDFESFTLGELNGQTGGDGIDGTWSSETEITEVTSAPSEFFVTLPTGEVISGGGQSLQVTGNSNQAISAVLETPQENTFYAAFLVQMGSGTITENDFATFWFGEGTHVGAPAIGIKADLGPNSTDLMGRISGLEEGYGDEQLAIGESYYLVAKVSKADGSTTYNQLEFWVNPGSDQEGSPDAISTSTIAFSDFASLGIRSANLGGDDAVYFDQITLATEWSDLFTPAPEPSTLLLSLLGCLAAFRRSRPAH